MSSATSPLDRLRKIVQGWPEVSERLSHGSPTFWGGKKTFCNYHDSDEAHGGRAIWIKATHDAQHGLIEADPQRFFAPPYVGPSGWVAVRMTPGVDWTMVAQLLQDAYRMVAPKRALRLLDGDQDKSRRRVYWS